MALVGIRRCPASKVRSKAQPVVSLAKLPINEELLAWTTQRKGFLGFRMSAQLTMRRSCNYNGESKS